MKINKSAIALAVCAALGSTGAMAASYAGLGVSADARKIYIGGATATDNVLEEGLISNVNGLCNNTLAINIYRAANQRVIVCTARATLTGAPANYSNLAGQVIAVHKESAGGSSNGVVPFTMGTSHALSWLDLDGLTAECTMATVAATTNLASYINHTNCTLVTIGAPTRNPHGGFSDTEPSLSSPAVTANQGFVPFEALDIVFGIPVTKNLYQALQIAQFGDSLPCDTNPAVGAYTISDTNPACVPSLASPQVRALYSQAYTDWNQIVRRADGTGLSSIPGVTAPTDTSVRICRRVAASGTQAGAESFWLGQRCVTTTQNFALPDDSSTVDDTIYSPSNFAESLVNANPSSGNVRTCMQAAQTGGFWGVGVLSTEVTGSNLSGAGDSFRMVAIDGYAPTLANVANGNYPYFTTSVITKGDPSTVPAPFAPPPALSPQQSAFVDAMRLAVIRNTAVLANLNATFANRPWGNGGVLAPQGAATSNTAPYSDADMAASPVNAVSKGGNNCVKAWGVAPTPTQYNAPLTPTAP
jgi:hypothetical protein